MADVRGVLESIEVGDKFKYTDRENVYQRDTEDTIVCVETDPAPDNQMEVGWKGRWSTTVTVAGYIALGFVDFGLEKVEK